MSIILYVKYKLIDKIQKELASDGIISQYVDRLHGIQGRNYQLNCTPCQGHFELV